MPPTLESYVAPARRAPQIWRLLTGLSLITAVILLPILGAVALQLAAPDLGARIAAILGDGPILTLVILFSFFPMALGPVLAAWLLHRRGPRSLIGPLRPAVRDFVTVVALVAVLMGLSFLLWPVGGDDLRPNLEPERWLVLLPLALLGLLIQTGAEEILFRGYLLQQLAARFRSPLAWMVLPSVAFGLLHYDPITMGNNSWLIVVATTLFGLIAADLTARTGTLGAAWGLHLANNAAALLVAAAAGPLDGLALWARTMPQDAEAMRPLLLLDMAGLLVIWALARAVLRRRLHSGPQGII